MTKIYIDYENDDCLNNIREAIYTLEDVNTYIRSPYSFRYKTMFDSMMSDIKMLKRDLQYLDGWLSGSLRDYQNFNRYFESKVNRINNFDLKRNIKIIK